MDEVSLAPVRADRATEVAAAYGVLDECARWLHGRGITRQWPVPYPADQVAEWAVEGSLYLATLPGGPAGTARLTWSEPTLWPEESGDAGYLGALAVARRFAGGGLGAVLVDRVAGLAAARGRRLLRLDCWAGNDGLAAYYRGLGFHDRGVITESIGAESWQVRRFERPIAG